MQEKLRCSEEKITDLTGSLSQRDGSCDTLRISPKQLTCDMPKYHNFWKPVNFADMLKLYKNWILSNPYGYIIYHSLNDSCDHYKWPRNLLNKN